MIPVDGWVTPAFAGFVAFTLPVPHRAVYYDPDPLTSIGRAQPTVVRSTGGAGADVRANAFTVQARLAHTNAYGVVLLDAFSILALGRCDLLLEVFQDDDVTLLFDVATGPRHDRPYLVHMERYEEQEMDPARGAVTIGTVTVTVVDAPQTPGDQDSGYVTARLAAAGHGDLQGRRCRLLRFIDDEANYVVVADGPAGTPELDDSYAAYRWPIRDTRETERKVVAFRSEEASTTLLPTGALEGYGYDASSDTWLVDPTTPLTGRFRRSGVNVALDFTVAGWMEVDDDPGNPEAQRRLNQANLDKLAGTFEWTGNGLDYITTFDAALVVLWRAAGSVGAYTEIPGERLLLRGTASGGPSPIAPKTSLVFAEQEEDADTYLVRRIFFGDSDSAPDLPADDQDVEVIIALRGGEPSKDAPRHLEGLTAGEFLRNGYDGLYSPRAPDKTIIPPRIRYNEAALLLMTDPVRLRLFEPIEDFRDWAEKYIYTPTGWVPTLNAEGEIAPVFQGQPADTSALPTLTAAGVVPGPDWDAGTRVINVLRFRYWRDFRPADLALAETGDGLREREVLVEFQDPISVARNGPQPLEIDARAFRALGGPDGEPVLGGQTAEVGWQLAFERRQYVHVRYARGAPAMRLQLRRDDPVVAGLVTGAWVKLDIPWLPHYGSGRRGLLAIAQAVAVGELDCATRDVLFEGWPLALDQDVGAEAMGEAHEVASVTTELIQPEEQAQPEEVAEVGILHSVLAEGAVPFLTGVSVTRQQAGTRIGGVCVLPYVYRVRWTVEDAVLPGYVVDVADGFDGANPPAQAPHLADLDVTAGVADLDWPGYSFDAAGADQFYQATVTIRRLSDDAVVSTMATEVLGPEPVLACLI